MRQVRDGTGADATQILVLGAGYDTMGWRLAPEFSNMNFFEIDHLAATRLKARGIEAMGLQDNFWLIPADLGKRDSLDVLKANAFLGSTGVNRHRSGRPCDVPVSRSCSEFVLSM